MTSHINNNEKIHEYVVYTRRKNKRNASDAICDNSKASKEEVDDHTAIPNHVKVQNGPKAPTTLVKSEVGKKVGAIEKIRFNEIRSKNKHAASDAISMNPKASKDKVSENMDMPKHAKEEIETKAPATLFKSKAGNKRGATYSDSDSDTSHVTINHSVKRIKPDTLEALSEVCWDKIKELDQPILNKDIKCTEEENTNKEKNAKHGRKKHKRSLMNKYKKPPKYPNLGAPDQSIDFQSFNRDEHIVSNALITWQEIEDARNSSRIDLNDKDKSLPNSSLHSKNATASGSVVRLIPENIDKVTSRRPSRNLKHKEDMDNWSEKELDTLWIAARRHGEGNWEAVMADQRMRVLHNKNPQELARKWDKEKLRHFASAKNKNVLSPTPQLHAFDKNAYSFTHTTGMQLPIANVLPRFPGNPIGFPSQRLMWNNPMLSQNLGLFGSYNQGLSHHPFANFAGVPHRAPYVINNLRPLGSELEVQPMSQRGNLYRNLRPFQGIQTITVPVIENRNFSSAKDEANEPKMLLGGSFKIPKNLAVNKSAAHGTSNSKSKSVVIKGGKGSSKKT